MLASAPRPLVVLGSMWTAMHPRSTDRLRKSFDIEEFDLLQTDASIARLTGRVVDAAIIRIEWLDMAAPYLQALEAANTPIRHIIATEQQDGMFPRQRMASLGVCGIIAETGSHAAVLAEIHRVLAECRCQLDAATYNSRLVAQNAVFERLVAAGGLDSGIVTLVAEGLTNEEIASSLHYSLQTVRNHLSHIMKQTRVRNRTELAHAWRRFAITRDLNLAAH